MHKAANNTEPAVDKEMSMKAIFEQASTRLKNNVKYFECCV